MFKSTLSRTAFVAVLIASAPVWADDAAAVKKTAHAQTQADESQIDAADVVTKPSVVAPLRPSSLGTLSARDAVEPKTLNAVSQAPSAPAAPNEPPVSLAPQLPHRAAALPSPAVPPAAAPAAFVAAPVPPQAPVVASPVPAAVAPAQTAAVAVASASTGNSMPDHVGEAPVVSTKAPEVQALANVGGVLTPYGKMVIEPFLQYARSSVNTFLFNGTQIANALLIGTVDANRTARDLVTAGATVRLGLNDRSEVEVRVPYVWRQDSLTNTIAGTTNTTTTSTAQGYGLGDLEIAGHYQINDGREDWPFFIGNLRFKSDTGSSPYKSQYNPDGSAHTLATGSGFMAIEPSLTVIYPTDPAILFANVGYIHSFDEDINGNVGGVYVGNVAPGDTYSASVGMGLAINDRLSMTLGYEHDYVRPTATVISGVTQNSQSLQVGSALSGLSFRVNNRTSVAVNLAAGVTKDAPDAVLSVRVPITLQAF